MIHRHQPPRLHAQFACPGAEAGSIAHRSIMCAGIGTRVKIINLYTAITYPDTPNKLKPTDPSFVLMQSMRRALKR